MKNTGNWFAFDIGWEELTFMSAVVITAWLVLFFVAGYTTQKERVGVTGLIGIVVGAVWMLIFPGVSLSSLVYSFLSSVGFYTFVVRPITQLLNIDYNQYIGLINKCTTKKSCK